MTNQSAGPAGIAYRVAAVAVVVWGLLGIIDMPNATYTGYFTTPQNVVNQVQPGSPAEAGGLRTGDRIESIGGIAIADTRAINRAPRVLPGDTRPMGIARDGQSMTIDLTYASPRGVQRAIAWAAILVGLVYLGLPLWAQSQSRSSASRILGWFGICFALAFLPGPYLASALLRNLAEAVVLTVIVLGFALLLKFVLSFPQESAFLAKPSARLWIWAPAGMIALMFIYLLLAEPDSTSAMGTIVNLFVGLFIIGYFGASLVVLVRRYLGASGEVRRSSGLSLMLWGAVVAMVPLVLTSILSLIAPMLVLPGQEFYFLILILIPIAFSLAVVQAARGQVGALAAT